MKLLHIDSSINGAESISRQVSQYVTDAWLQQHPDTVVEYLDLAENAPAHLNRNALALRNPTVQAEGGSEVESETAVTEQLLNQFLAADVIVIGAPFYNFTIPSQLKAWIDRILQPRRTFQYGANGPEGLAAGKKVIIASSRGGFYNNEQGSVLEHQESYLRVVFKFVGITDIHFIHAEGIGKGPEAVQAALEHARKETNALLLSSAEH